MEYLIPVLVILAILAALVPLAKKLVPQSEPAQVKLPYRKKEHLLTAAERSFYGVLRGVIGDDIVVFAKVRLIDLVWMPQGTENRQSHMNRVVSKHVDFVLCDSENVAPLLAIWTIRRMEAMTVRTVTPFWMTFVRQQICPSCECLRNAFTRRANWRRLLMGNSPVRQAETKECPNRLGLRNSI
jgi:hypothetical protein